MKLLKKILFTILTIFMLVILIFNLYNFYSIKILKKDLPTINGYGILEVASGSMSPTLNIGDLIIINTNQKDYHKNDIITFYDVNGSFVTHRLISIDKDTMITKGDANNTEDESLPTKNIVGKYIFKINSLGKLISSLKNPLVSIMIFVIGILICILISINQESDLIDEKEFQEYLQSKETIKENKLKLFFKNLKFKFKKNKPKKKKVKKKKRVKKVKPKRHKKKKKKRK